MKTDFETLKSLSSYTINFLTDAKMIEYSVSNRIPLVESLATELNVSFATDEDIRDQAIEEVEDKMGVAANLDVDITETEMYNHARKEIVKAFNGETISGLYLVESLNQVAHRVKDFLMGSDLVDDVFATDEEVVEFLVGKIRSFNTKRA